MLANELTLDSNPRDFLSPQTLAASESQSLAETDNNPDIAPWLGQSEPEAPTPPPKPNRSFGVPHMHSFSSFSIPRQPSSSNLFPRASRGSESHSIADSTLSSALTYTMSSHSNPSIYSDMTLVPSQSELRKPKSGRNLIGMMIKRTKSRSRLRSETDRPESPPDPLPAFVIGGPPSPSLNLNIANKKDRLRKKSNNVPPPLPPKAPSEPEMNLDTNLDDMEGIIDPTVLPSIAHERHGSSSSGFESYLSSSMSQSELSLHPPIFPTNNPVFINPFHSSPPAKRKHHTTIDHRKVSPRSLPPSATTLNPPALFVDGDSLNVPSWAPPESWGFVNKDGDDIGEPEYSSSDESARGSQRPTSTVVLSNDPPSNHKRKSRRKPPKPPKPHQGSTYSVRIYRANNTYHVASIDLSVTVADLTPVLNQKLLLDSTREMHRLYLKERGRERVLAQTERPADIVRRRLEQAGYNVVDGLEKLGAEDMTFLMKFVYKTQLLGPAEQDLEFDTFEHIDLTGRGLRTIPVVLHGHADIIVSLSLSRNPMLEIPLDFIQSCTTLRALRLSNMAMKKVPQSVRHSVTLNRLDISCNRIVDLNEAGLDHIPELTTLGVQNNRMEKLPWYFPHLRSLRYLNISNNKFRHLPAVVSEIVTLVDLDISFNMISEIPEEIGQLVALEQLIIVGNQVTKFPDECRNLSSLRVLDCRRNHISDLSVVCMLPMLETLRADHNAVHALDLSLGPHLATLDASRNDITQLALVPGPIGRTPYALTSLDLSYAKLSSLDNFALAQLSSLQTLKLDHNSFRFIPESLGELSRLVFLSCSDNNLDSLPSSIGRLQKLETLDAHNNSLKELPISLWNCASLCVLNVTSNLLGVWHDPPTVSAPAPPSTIVEMGTSPPGQLLQPTERKTSSSGSIISHSGRLLPPLAHSLERLYIGENMLTDDVLHPLTILKELRVLNLSFNQIQDLPPSFFKNLGCLEELYLSGNKLSSFPSEDLHRLTKLTVLFLNGNKLQTLPQELGKISSLAILDVGNNVLRYNINNWQFDWNWNFNQNLKYLNFSGNKRLEIKPDKKVQQVRDSQDREILADFSGLTQLRVLGLMDVTTKFLPNIPDENEDRRVRTSLSEVNKMAYGISDNLGKNGHMNMLDLVQPEFRDKKNEAVFAMFGRAQPFASNNRLTKFLHDKFLGVFSEQLDSIDPLKNEVVPDALRRSFLRLNKLLHDELYTLSSTSRKMSQASTSTANTSHTDLNSSIRSGACGIVLYFVDKTMHVANAGNALAVVSRGGAAKLISTKHDPFDRNETARIRAAEGWVSPKGLVNDEIDVSRSFGFFHLVPVVNACPDVCTWQISETDEFVIIGNRGLWDYVSYQTAVDIARSERADPMTAAQKLRDFAISYGAEGSTMIMVISIADLFNTGPSRKPTMESFVDFDTYSSINKRRKKDDTIADRNISRLDGEVPPPTGHIALAFTDIRNSTHLWEVNAGMPTAMRLHNNLLRRQLRFCGGYEVKTEGDAFMCSFPTALSALWWCMTVQVQLLHEPWPLEILECEDGKEIFDAQGRLIARGLSVRMGIHCGMPVCEPDPITHRMDYFGPMVNRSARINGSAAGGQIMCSADIIREINAKILGTEPDTDLSDFQPPQAIEAIRRIGVTVITVGEVKLKGLEIPEVLSAVYPTDLAGRQDLEENETGPNASGSRIQFSVAQMRELAMLCLRLEALASSRVFRSISERKGSIHKAPSINRIEDERPATSVFFFGDPNLLLPPMNEKASDSELMTLLDSLSGRVENALSRICHNSLPAESHSIVHLLQGRANLDERTFQQLLSLLRPS